VKAIVFLLALFIVGDAAYAQQAVLIDCAGWGTVMAQGDGVTAKGYYLVGFRDGIAAMAHVNAANRPRADEVMANVWSAGVTPDQLRLMLDGFCSRPEKRTLPVAAAIVEITREHNAR